MTSSELSTDSGEPDERAAVDNLLSRRSLASIEYEGAAQTPPDAVLAVDHDGVIRYANPGARDLLADSEGRLVGQALGFPVGTGTVELELRTPTGPRGAEMRVTQAVLDGVDRLVVRIRDVEDGPPERRQIAEELQNVDNALAVTSHELRNPLSVLAMSVATLIERWGRLDEDQVLHELRRIERNIMRMAFTIDSILDAARISSGNFQPVSQRVDLHALVLERLPELGEAANGIRVSIPKGTEVEAHPDHVWMVIANFLVNSLKYGAAPREIRVVERGPLTVVEVADAGRGVPEDQAVSLFDRYTRGPGQEGVAGTGLGLWIARSIAEAYGGLVYYQAGDPAGAVFCCALPGTRPGVLPRPVPAREDEDEDASQAG